MLMFKRCAREICRKNIKPRIDAVAPNSGFGKAYRILFYAGPADEIKKAVYGVDRRINPAWKRAGHVAHRLKAKRIDNTEIFEYLMGTDYAEVLEDYKTRYGLSDQDKKALNQEVWNYTSARFARTDFKEAMTLVCGAGSSSSFRVKEMESLLNGKHLTLLNNLPASMFKEIQKLGKKELFRFCCMTALIVLKEYAEQAKTKAAMREFEQQLKYFHADQKTMLKEFLDLPTAKQEKISQAETEILKKYGLYDKFEKVLKKEMGVEVIFPVLVKASVPVVAANSNTKSYSTIMTRKLVN